MKKLLLSFALIITLVGSALTSTSFASASPDNKILNQQKANIILKQIYPKVVKDDSISATLSQFNNAYGSEYGGSYLDEEGFLNINLVGNGQNVKGLIKDTNVNYHSVNYSLQNLKDINNSLCDRMVELGIKALELDEKNNKVIIYLDNLHDVEKIHKIKKVVDSPAIEYQKMDGKIVLTSTNVVNGSAATAGTESFTVGVGAIKNGQKGWLVPGHITAIEGGVMKYNGTTIGTIQQKVLSGSVDASFVLRTNSSYNLVDYFPTGDFYTGWDNFNYGSGNSITAYGMISGKQSGYILNNDFSYTANGTTITHAVKASYRAIHGDSGAPVTIYYSSNGRGILGLQSASAFDANNNWQYSIYTRINYISSALGVGVSLN